MHETLLSRDEMERRRLAAAQDLLGGVSQADVARKFGVSRTTASRWQRALASSGFETLRKRRATGRPSRLTPEQRDEVVAIHAAGPRAWGFDADRWTTARLSEAIRARFGVRYDPDHVGRLMHRLGLRKRRDRAILAEPQHRAAGQPEQALPYVPPAYPFTAGMTTRVQ